MRAFPVTPDPSKVLLIDTSKWQNDPNTPRGVDFQTMKSKGCSGVIMKVGQGLYVDRDWNVNAENSILAELPRGGYWYYDNRVEPKRQAQVMATAVGSIPVELGLWLDLEDKQEGVYRGWKNWYVFLEKLKELCPNLKIGIYTGYYYWVERTIASQIPKGSLNYFKQFPLWIAAYNSQMPLVPAPWKPDYLIWQFTDLLDGKAYGAESIELDGNYFNGTAEAFRQYFGFQNIISVPNKPPEPTQKFIVGLQEYALSLDGDVHKIQVIQISSDTKYQEAVRLMQYILDLDRKLQGE